MNMIPCDGCGRHHDATDSRCPFCFNGRSPIARKALYLVGGAVTTVVLAACYGVGGFDEFGNDFDNDGWSAPQDCDDNNPDINPGAVELCDDETDNNCDGLLDTADANCEADTDDSDTDDSDTDDSDTDTDG